MIRCLLDKLSVILFGESDNELFIIFKVRKYFLHFDYKKNYDYYQLEIQTIEKIFIYF